MCGITGIIDFEGLNISVERLTNMVTAIAHRGPDASNIWTERRVSLGHTRLSIIDLSVAANQPMHSIDDRHVIVFNGEIYNFHEIRAQLQKIGVVFITNSDTEVVMMAYAKWGIKSLELLNGIFAFAIWDREKDELILARDRFGVKPLYYLYSNKCIVFGSEIKSIIASGKYTPQINPQSLSEFNYFGVSLGENTLFKEIHKLLPGNYILINSNSFKIESFWSAHSLTIKNDDEVTACTNIKSLLEMAVKRQLLSDVPVGVFLSGGIDSSAITAFASKHYSNKLQTYSVGFDFDKGVNELPRAKRVANYFSTKHSEFYIKGADMPSVIEKLVLHHDEPFSDAANIPLYLLCKELNGNPKVVLQGDGGDEIFGGYRRYALLANEKYWRFASHFRWATEIIPGEKAQRLRRLLYAFGQSNHALKMAHLLTMDTKQHNLSKLFSVYWKNEIQVTDPFKRYKVVEEQIKNFDSVQKMLYTDSTILLPDVFLEKVDKSTMAHGIESRVPFLDNELSQYVMSLPSSMKVKGNNKKHLLKLALRGVVPDEVLDGPKTGFGVPYSYWLATSLYDYSVRIFSVETSRTDSFFERKHIFNLLYAHKRNPTQQTGFILWKALNLSIWHQNYFKS